MDIDMFNSHIMNYGVVQPNRYTAYVTPPNKLVKKLSRSLSYSLSELTFRCKSVTLPYMDLKTETSLITGSDVNMPLSFSHEGMSMTFYEDKKFGVYSFFDHWSKFSVGRSYDLYGESVGAFYNSYYNDIIGIINLTVSSPSNDSQTFWVVNEVYPKSVKVSDLTSENTNTVATVTVDFNYASFKVVGEGHRELTSTE